MEGWGQIPSQPSNFVSLLHLRERWLEQNEHQHQHQHQHQHPDQKPEAVNPVNAAVDKAEPLLAESHEKKKKSKKNLHHNKRRSQNRDVVLAVSLIQCDEKKHLVKNKTASQSEDVGEALLPVSPVESEDKNKKSMEKHLVKKKPRSQSDDVGEALLPVSPIKTDEKQKQPMNKKPTSQSEDVGELLLAVSPFVCHERKKKKSMKKHLMEKKPRSQGEEVPAILPIESGRKKKKSKRKPVSQSTEMDRTSPTPEENFKDEMGLTECQVGEQKDAKDVKTSPTPEVNLKKGMRGKKREVGEQSEKKYVWARRIDEKKGFESQCGSGTANRNAMKEIENKLSRISVSFENKRGRNNGVYKGSSRGNRDLHRLAPQKQRDSGMIWVRKDELPKSA